MDDKRYDCIFKILSEWDRLYNLEETEELNNLIFKGGALLSMEYLNGHRITEDLDFAYSDSNNLREIPPCERINVIKSKVEIMLKEIDMIAKNLNLVFHPDLDDSRFVKIKNKGNIYIFRIYYNLNSNKYVDIEISFIETLNGDYKEKVINTGLGSYCTRFKIKIYSLEEIALEKIRTVLTRTTIEKKDLFDLYCINKLMDIFELQEDLILKKIRLNNEMNAKHNKNFLSRKELIKNNLWGDINQDVKFLIDLDLKEFESFKSKLLVKLKRICLNY